MKKILGLALATLAITQQECGGRSTPQEIPAGTNLVEVNATNFPPQSTANLPCNALKMEKTPAGNIYHIYISGQKTQAPGTDTFSVEVLKESEKIPPYTGIFDDSAKLGIKDMRNCGEKAITEAPVSMSSAILKDESKQQP